jgi:hypothetical protein
MIALEQNIDNLYRETEQSADAIIRGSDEHLDLILLIKKPLESLTQKLGKLNDALLKDTDLYSEEQLRNIVMPKLWQLNKACLVLLGAIKTSFLYKDIRSSFKNYNTQHEVLREILHDLHNIRLAKDDEFDNLLKELNNI